MNNSIKCQNCGGEWFDKCLHQRLSDDLYAEGGLPWGVESRHFFVCLDCGEKLDLEPYEIKRWSA